MPKRVDHDERRSQIVDALLRLAARGGLPAVTFREVAAEADVSVRLVQYYFGSKAELLRAANAEVGARAAKRLAAAVAAMGPDPAPREVARVLVHSFLPTDDAQRRETILFYAFFAEQLTSPALRLTETGVAPHGLRHALVRQVHRAHLELGTTPPAQTEDRARFLVNALPGIAAGVVVGTLELDRARDMVDDALEWLFAERGSLRGTVR